CLHDHLSLVRDEAIEICCLTVSSCSVGMLSSRRFSIDASPCLKAFMLPGRPLLPLTPPLPWNACHSYPNRHRMIFVYSIRDMFVCSLGKTFGHLSDRAKKIEIYKALTLGHYIRNKVFVSHFVTCRVSPLAAHPRVGLVRIAWRVRRALLFYRPKAERALVF